MAYVVVEKDGSEWIHDEYPEVKIYNNHWLSKGDSVRLPKGTIKKLIGRTLTWDDKPVKINKNTEQNIERNTNIDYTIDWEERKFQLVKDLLKAYFIARGNIEYGDGYAHEWAFRYADRVIKDYKSEYNL